MTNKLSRLDRALFKSLIRHCRILDSRPLLRASVLSDASTGWGGYYMPENITRGPFVTPSWDQREPGAIRGLSLIRAFAAAEPPPSNSRELPFSSSSSSSSGGLDYKDEIESVGKDEEELSTRQQWYVPPILSPTTNEHPQQRIHSAVDFLRQCFRRQFATGLNSSPMLKEERGSSATINAQPLSSSILIEDQNAAFFALRFLTDRLSIGKHLGFDLIPTNDLGGETVPSPPSMLSPLYAAAERASKIEPGTLLLSHPFLEAPFDRKVILILEHDAGRGTIGVVINPDRVIGKVSNLTSAFMTPVVRSSALSSSPHTTRGSEKTSTAVLESESVSQSPPSLPHNHRSGPSPSSSPPSSSSSSSSSSTSGAGGGRRRGGGGGGGGSAAITTANRLSKKSLPEILPISSLTPTKIRQILKEVEEEFENDAIAGAESQSASSFSSTATLHDTHSLSMMQRKSMKSGPFRTRDSASISSPTWSASANRRYNRHIRNNSLYRLSPSSSSGSGLPRQSSSSSPFSAILDDASISHFDAVYNEDSIDAKPSSSSSSSFHFSEAEAFGSLNPHETSGRNRDRSLRSSRTNSLSAKALNHDLREDTSDRFNESNDAIKSSPAAAAAAAAAESLPTPAPRNAVLNNIFSKASVLARASTAHVLLGRLRGAGIPAEKISAHAIVAASVPGERSSLGLSLLPLGPGLDMPSSTSTRKEQAEFDLKTWVPVVQLPVALVDLTSGATYGGGVNTTGSGGEEEHLEEELRGGGGGAASLSNDDPSSSDEDNTSDDDDDDDTVSGSSSSLSSVSRGMKTKGRGEGVNSSRRGGGGERRVTDESDLSSPLSSSSSLASLSTDEINALVASATDALALEVARLDKGKGGGSDSEAAKLLRTFASFVRADSDGSKLGSTTNTRWPLANEYTNDSELSLESEVLPIPPPNQRRRSGRRLLTRTASTARSTVAAAANADSTSSSDESINTISSSSTISLSSNQDSAPPSSSSIGLRSKSTNNRIMSKRSSGSSSSSSSSDDDDDDNDRNEDGSSKAPHSSNPLISGSSIDDVLKIFGDKKVYNGGPVPGYYLVLHPYDFLGRYAIHPTAVHANSDNSDVTINNGTQKELSNASSSSFSLTQKPLFVLRDVRDAAKVAASVNNARTNGNNISFLTHSKRLNRRRGTAGSHQQQQENLTSSSSFTFFSGASRWHQGQLEDEIMEGSWLLVKHAQVADLVLANDKGSNDEVGSGMWSRILHTLGGEFTSWAIAPPHPE